MRMMWRKIAIITLAWAIFCTPAGAVPLADSQAEFSGVQGQDNWSYGFFNLTATGGPFTTGGFVAFATFNAARWEASDAQIGAQNNGFLSINQVGGHPAGIGPGTQDSIIWAVRRYQSEVSGLVDIALDLRKLNVLNSAGGGITGRVFIDGVEVFTQFIANLDDVGVQPVITRVVALGSLIDFVIDPTGSAPVTGNDGIFSARADGSHFSAVIAAHVTEPGGLAVLGAGLVLFALVGRRWRAGRAG